MTTDSDWAELHDDLLNLIGKKIKVIQDFVPFGLVCKSWHAAAAERSLPLLSMPEKEKKPPIPLLLLPEKEDDIRSRQLYSLSKGKILSKNLYIRKAARKKCIGLNYGCILAVSPRGKMYLLHPLSGFQIKLPHQKSIYKYNGYMTDPPYCFTNKAALSANPSESSDFVLMITHGWGCMCLGYWRPGDKTWTRIETGYVFSDLIYYQDRFYVIAYNGSIWSCKVSKNEEIVCQIKEAQNHMFFNPKLVGSAGALLVFDRGLIRIHGRNEKFTLYEIDLIKGGWNQIISLGDRTIFVGNNTTICLDKASEFPGIKSNHIYCTDDFEEEYSTWEIFYQQRPDSERRKGGQDMGYYSLEDDQIKPFDIEESLNDICPPFWFLPSSF